MKFIKIILVFAFAHFALPTGYSITLPKIEQDSIKPKRKISNEAAFNMVELTQGITSVIGGIVIFWLGSKFMKVANISIIASFGKFLMVVGALGFIIGALLLVHFFVRRQKKKKVNNIPS